MVTIKLKADKVDQLVVLPTIIVDSTEKAENARVGISFAWLHLTFTVGIAWTRKESKKKLSV